MPVQSVVSIDVDDARFREFQAQYDAFQAKLKELPSNWTTANDAMASGMGVLIEQQKRVEEAIKRSTAAQVGFNRASERSGKSLDRMQKAARAIREDFRRVQSIVTHLGSIGLGALTLGLGGSLFGLDRLAGAATKRGFTAAGLGLSPGQLAAFRANFTGLAPQDMLQRSFAMQQNLSERGLLAMLAGRMGTSEHHLQSENAADFAQSVMQEARKYAIAHRGDANAFSSNIPLMQAFAAAGLSLEDVKRLGNVPGGMLAASAAGYRRDVGKFTFGPQATADWFTFQRRLREAGMLLETTFIKDLHRLGPSLGGLIKEFTSDAAKLIGGVLNPTTIDHVRAGIDHLAAYLKSGAAQKSFSELVANVRDISAKFSEAATQIGAFGAALHAILKTLGILNPEKTSRDVVHLPENLHKLAQQISGGNTWETLHIGTDGVWLKPASQKKTIPGLNPELIRAGKRLENQPASVVHTTLKNYAAFLDRLHHFPAGFLETQVGLESGWNPRARSSKGAVGLGQFMPGTASDEGLKDLLNPVASLAAMADYDAKIRQHLAKVAPGEHGSQLDAMTIAGYNAGAGRIGRNVVEARRENAPWWKFIPLESQIEASRYLARNGGTSGMSRDVAKTASATASMARNMQRGIRVHITSDVPMTARYADQANAATF